MLSETALYTEYIMQTANTLVGLGEVTINDSASMVLSTPFPYTCMFLYSPVSPLTCNLYTLECGWLVNYSTLL